MTDIKVGDEVRVRNAGGIYKSYESFFDKHNISKDFWEIGVRPNIDKQTFEVTFIGMHEDNDHASIAVCKSKLTGKEYLYALYYLEKVGKHSSTLGDDIKERLIELRSLAITNSVYSKTPDCNKFAEIAKELDSIIKEA